MLLEEGVYYDQFVLLAKHYQPLPCFVVYSKTKFAHYSRCFLTSYFCIPVPYNEQDMFFWVLVLEGLVGVHRTVDRKLPVQPSFPPFDVLSFLMSSHFGGHIIVSLF